MERMGLVSQVETELERMISLDLLPADRSLPSEQKLARCFGVSRATVREGLLRLSSRGLVVQHPGRKSRAVVLDEAVTLESLSVVLHSDARTQPDRGRLLEGFFALKREATVELLAACCDQASAAELRQLEDVCFLLRESAHWNEDSGDWAQHEFGLLRLAARIANRPGHFLLIQSLERAFWAMVERLAPHMNSKAVQAWAQCALTGLKEKNALALRRELSPLLQACDEQLLGNLVPKSRAAGTCEPSCAAVTPLLPGESPSEVSREELPGAVGPNRSDSLAGSHSSLPGAVGPNRSDSLVGSRSSPPPGSPQPEASLGGAWCEPECVAPGESSPPGHEEKGEGRPVDAGADNGKRGSWERLGWSPVVPRRAAASWLPASGFEPWV
jgi:GntR family transcriptional repressor for pyruvate dehydrogenase complex